MELVVAMALTLILGVVSTEFFVNIQKSGNTTILKNSDTGDARSVLDSWTSYIRLAGWVDPATKANRFEEITPTKIVFFANLKNRPSTTSFAVDAPTKIALMFILKPGGSGDGELVEVRFVQNAPSTVASVRHLALNVTKTGSTPIFQPLKASGSVIDVSQTSCFRGTTPVQGLCLQAGTGMNDPTVAYGSNVVSEPSPKLLGNSTNIDDALGQVGGIQISFTARDTSHTVSSMAFTSTATVSSGYPS